MSESESTTPDNTPEQRQEWKAAILEGLENAGSDRKAYEPAFVQAFGPGPGVLMSQLFFWTGKGMDPAGWIYKTEHEWKWETGLSRDQQRKARKILKAKGVLEEDKKGLPRKLYFRIKLERLGEVVLETLNQRYGQTPKACQTSEEPKGCQTCQTPDGHLSGRTPEGCHTGEEPKGCLACRVATGASLLQRVLTQSTSDATSVSPSDLTSRESAFQAARNVHFAPLQERIVNQSREEDARYLPSHEIHEDRWTEEVRRVLTSGDRGLFSPKALAHYRTGHINLDEIAPWVSYDLTDSESSAERLAPAVERVVAELGAVEEAAQS